jgi:TolB protein
MARLLSPYTPRLAGLSILALVLFISRLTLSVPAKPLGAFEHHQDVGDAKLAGNAVYTPTDQTYTLSSPGPNRGLALEQFHLAWKKITGDFIIQATVRFAGSGALPRRELGIMARDTLAGSSRYVAASVHGDTVTALQYRAADGAAAAQVAVSSFHPTEIQLTRTGNRFTLSSAVFGENYKSVSHDMALADEVYVGAFVASGESGVAQGVFSNVRVIIPPGPGFKPYDDYLGSHLEVMDVATGHRRILHSEPGSIQSPNWTPNDKLIYNSAAGVMYTYDIATGQTAELETGPRRQNNNDHVLSFDGKMLALSNFTGEPSRSVAFILPVTGSSNPKQITSPDVGHTFLHGWSPDGKKLVFTGGRKGETGDYRNLWSVDIETKVETALTPPGTLDDGPEYTPDGKYIYFNSVRTGTMQIWRMRPDGSHPEQVTFDESNDWFPHISPDGKWLVYIAFPTDMNPWAHPFYKPCYIRLMPTAGGVPKTIGYIYGGQGSMNTPGWSPDSKRIAFVSNSKL